MLTSAAGLTGEPCIKQTPGATQRMLAPAYGLTHSRLHSGQAERVFSHRWMQSCRGWQANKRAQANSEGETPMQSCSTDPLCNSTAHSLRAAATLSTRGCLLASYKGACRDCFNSQCNPYFLASINASRIYFPPPSLAHQVENMAACAPGNGKAWVVGIACEQAWRSKHLVQVGMPSVAALGHCSCCQMAPRPHPAHARSTATLVG